MPRTGKAKKGKQSAVEIPIGAASNSTSPSPPYSPPTQLDADADPSLVTRLRRRVPQIHVPTNPQPRKRGRPKFSAAQGPPRQNTKRKEERATYSENEAPASDTDESQGEADNTEVLPTTSGPFSDDEVKAREGPSGASSSTIPTTDATPQWASQLLTAIAELGKHIQSLDAAVRRLNSPPES